ncbi:MAG: FAD-dependent oxidoreductase [Candidatus Dependentiae bacterium]|nr:FAD-dependent oxidoreductase [Candidatus Dependentiae bacterium]
MNTKKIIHLTPPRITPEHIKEKITCIRAHRERIFQVFTQMHDNKLVCHNYGHGGAGWTFLFGCVNESISQFEDEHSRNATLQNKSIVVIGAGCYGLLTAIMLRRKGHTVHIIAKETKNIPSNKSAGFFFPRHRKSSTTHEKAIFQAMGMESYKTFLEIINGTHPFIKQGPKLLPAYFGLDIDPGFAPYIEQGLVQQPEQVTIDFNNGKTYEAMAYHTVFINSAAIMQELQRNVDELNISIEKKEVSSFDECNESIIFNCAGLGAKTLTGDKRLIPVQGHLITLKDQSPLDELQYMINVKVVMTDALGKKRDELIYYAPRESGILGITFKRGEDSLTTNHHEFDRLLQRCQDYFGE